MPSYLDFDSTKKFRDFIIGKTLNQPNGPQTFTNSTYTYNNLSSLPNINPGDVVTNDVMNRTDTLNRTSNFNLYRPIDGYEGLDRVLNTNVLDQTGLPLRLYPYFDVEPPKYNLYGILNANAYDSESKLFQFASSYIKNSPEGPIYSRLTRNIEKTINGKVRLLDALNGNTSTALNLVTGREPLVEFNNSITVAKTLPGKAVDFLQSVAGITLPFTEIPGDYLTNPFNSTNNTRPTASTEVGKFLQDLTGAIGSMVGIQRRPLDTRKPSDLLIEYMGQGPKQSLFNNLAFSKYAPDYTTTARSQNTSKVFNFVDDVAQGVKNVLGLEAPKGNAYIGDDRGDDVKFAMGDFNDRPVRSSYYLSLMFDKISAEIFHKSQNITEGGSIGGNLTWYSKNSKNKLGSNNAEYTNQEQSVFLDTLSTKYGFRDDSILGETQRILDSLPSDGGASRSHVANVIDQTSRVFVEGDTKISRGSAIKYIDKYSNDEAGVEYCRVWTKDRGYMNYSDTMKRTSNIRKFDSSVMGGKSRPWNLNIAPMSNGKRSFDGSTNIVERTEGSGDFYAKKYMFSLENLAWKTSNTDGFRVSDLPACERGPNGGRVMWFPPYDLKVSEQNNARWEENSFIGRPELLYTYQNTSRTGQVSFKVIVDHPSIMNLMSQDLFNNMSDAEADNYINAFFAGCKDLDLYELLKTYVTIDVEDATLIQLYLNSDNSPDPQTIKKFRYISTPMTVPGQPPTTTTPPQSSGPVNFDAKLFFDNDFPKVGSSDTTSSQTYDGTYESYLSKKNTRITGLETDLTELLTGPLSGKTGEHDRGVIFKSPYPLKGLTGLALTNKKNEIISGQTASITSGFATMETAYAGLNAKAIELKNKIETGEVTEATLTITTATSEVADDNYNLYLGIRRGHSILRHFLNLLIASDSSSVVDKKWITPDGVKKTQTLGAKINLPLEFTFKDLGFSKDGKLNVKFTTNGENTDISNPTGGQENINCHQPITTKKGLKVTAPIAFFCRQASAKLEYTPVPKKPTEKVPEPNIQYTTTVEEYEDTIPGTAPKKPNINVMQRIIMKMLSECYYFKKLEEDSPLAFKSLSEKIKYFHPAFHSMTPEGLNARLTFLHQCVRPGDTIPVKGISDNLDIGARNTSFGPPPICVMRIGDFYHSKVVIRDINISFEENVWDLNPEGIGVQPMIATVQLQIAFIGGQGLEAPVDRLQNALSSNFYANTEMYDERATITSKINGKSADDFMRQEFFTKDFLDKINERVNKVPKSEADSAGAKKSVEGKYIGVDGQKLSYSPSLLYPVYEKTNAYFESYDKTYNELLKLYGEKPISLFFSNTYRKVNTFTVKTDGSDETIELLGEYKVSDDLSNQTRGFKTGMVSAINSNYLNDILNLTEVIPEPLRLHSEKLLQPYMIKFVEGYIDGMMDKSSIKNLEQTRESITTILDSLNFITQYGSDGKIDGQSFTEVYLNVTEFNSAGFYKEYSPIVKFIKDNHTKLTSKIVDFTPSTIDTATLKEILSVFLQGERKNIVDLYKNDAKVTKIFTEKIINKIDDKLKKFIVTPSPVKFKYSKVPKYNKDKKVEYSYGTPTNEVAYDTEVLTKIMNAQNKLGDTLNFYKK
jgi:hypothetical protein